MGLTPSPPNVQLKRGVWIEVIEQILVETGMRIL